MLQKISSLILAALLLIFFQSLKLLLLDMGFSWSLSFLLPYVFLLLFGFLLAKTFKNVLQKLNPWLQKTIIILLFGLPFGIGFGIYPIYQGDVFGQSKTVVNVYPEFNSYDLVLLTIPECKYCHETIKNMNKLVERNPRIRILYIVCSSNSGEIQPYRRKLHKKIDVRLAKNLNNMTSLAGSSFPVYLHAQGKQLRWYDNNNFGTRTLDAIENEQ